jgi:hypothetical protein
MVANGLRNIYYKLDFMIHFGRECDKYSLFHDMLHINSDLRNVLKILLKL